MSHIWQPDPDKYMGYNYLVLDFETDTSHGDFGHAVHPDNGLLLASTKRALNAPVSYWGDEFDQADLLQAIADCDVLVWET